MKRRLGCFVHLCFFRVRIKALGCFVAVLLEHCNLNPVFHAGFKTLRHELFFNKLKGLSNSLADDKI